MLPNDYIRIKHAHSIAITTSSDTCYYDGNSMLRISNKILYVKKVEDMKDRIITNTTTYKLEDVITISFEFALLREASEPVAKTAWERRKANIPAINYGTPKKDASHKYTSVEWSRLWWLWKHGHTEQVPRDLVRFWEYKSNKREELRKN